MKNDVKPYAKPMFPSSCVIRRVIQSITFHAHRASYAGMTLLPLGTRFKRVLHNLDLAFSSRSEYPNFFFSPKEANSIDLVCASYSPKPIPRAY